MKNIKKMLPVKYLSRHKSLLFCYIVSIVLISCTKDDVTGIVGIEKGNPTSYLLEQLTYVERDGSNSAHHYFQYDSSDQVTEIKGVSWKNGRYEIIFTYRFEYVNQLAVKCRLNADLGSSITDYDYIGDHVSKQTRRLTDGTFQDSTVYEYDSDGKPVETIVYTDKVAKRSQYTYDKNIITRKTYIFNNSPQEKYKIEYSGFDNKINFIRTINGLPKIFVGDDFSFFLSTTPAIGNHTIMKYYANVRLNENYGVFDTYKNSYEYNEEGLPTKMHFDGFTIIFKYRKYK
jgi:hypothetical protein